MEVSAVPRLWSDPGGQALFKQSRTFVTAPLPNTKAGSDRAVASVDGSSKVPVLRAGEPAERRLGDRLRSWVARSGAVSNEVTYSLPVNAEPLNLLIPSPWLILVSPAAVLVLRHLVFDRVADGRIRTPSDMWPAACICRRTVPPQQRPHASPLGSSPAWRAGHWYPNRTCSAPAALPPSPELLTEPVLGGFRLLIQKHGCEARLS